MLDRFKALTARDPATERVIPTTGLAAALTLFSSGAMAFLAVFALALALAASDLAEQWEEGLARTATVRLSPAPEEAERVTNAVLETLAGAEGVVEARLIASEEQARLLAPWLGEDIPLDVIDLPPMIEVVETAAGPNRDALAQSLETVSPGAIYDGHERWQAPFAAAAGRLRAIAIFSLVLIGLVMAVTTGFAVSAALAAHGQIVEVLRLVGARDRWITRAFVRRFTVQTALGAFAGTFLALIFLALMPGGEGAGILDEVGLSGTDWLWPLLLPPAAALLAFGATHAAATYRLRKVA